MAALDGGCWAISGELMLSLSSWRWGLSKPPDEVGSSTIVTGGWWAGPAR